MAFTGAKNHAAAHEERVDEGVHAEPALDPVHHPTGFWNWRLIVNMIIIGLSLGLYGYDNNFVAPLLALPLFILKYQGHGPAFTVSVMLWILLPILSLTSILARNLDLIVTVPLVGAASGSFVAVPLMKRIGRKKTMMLAYFCLCTPGSILQVFAPNIGALVVGRFWNYVGISVLTTTAPLYLTELVPAHIRARAVGFCVAGVCVVAIIATTIVWGTEKIDDSRQYKVPLAIQATCPVVFGVLMLFCYESPLWYVQNGKLDDARRALMALRNNATELVETELSLSQAAVVAERERREQSRFWDILNRTHLQRTLTAGTLLCSGQVGGQILMQTYSTVILVQSGVADPFQITIIITCLQFLGTMVGPVLVDKVGRRPVALAGFSILFVLDMAAGSLAAAGLTTKGQQLGLAAVFIVFAFFNAASFQSLAFLLPAEIPTPSLREPTMAWSTFWSYCTAVITTFAVPQITAPDAGNLGAQAAFIFGGCVFVTVIWSYFYIPETMARSAAEIDEMYAAKLPMRKWRGYKSQTVREVMVDVRRESVEKEAAHPGSPA
ncbi:hypothetical protein G647_04088 [Cladophialophora carrionii CBS 160.54]|uniref:Major facilitator superfamily (MFS) profile domain-containing protein n=1 Tax=Cladophialophora carrionii CBS 160.54 TaxID=1279043 RepID=V9DCU1_9EURO|nr:uncharacterized protein G647_04088 [Cladophialophora carrionii CBS 160.54]ETI24719.1 hypothetical protein G647_04088 [Cladophialophora carrionii CBS 160.54]